MRKKIVAGNWKMNKTLQEGLKFSNDLKEALKGKTVNCEVVVGTPFIHLSEVAKNFEGTVVHVAAQNIANKEKGAYTGEVSAAMVASTGANHVILGHSERRAYYHETAELLTEKVELALANDLTPIFCVGEVLEEREAGKHFDVVAAQIKDALFELSKEDFSKLIVAYEPVWAIGTGKTATSDQAEEMHAYIRRSIANKFAAYADNTPILYGGSCKPSNAQELFSKDDVDGGLIGGAALVAQDFAAIIKSF